MLICRRRALPIGDANLVDRRYAPALFLLHLLHLC